MYHNRNLFSDQFAQNISDAGNPSMDMPAVPASEDTPAALPPLPAFPDRPDMNGSADMPQALPSFPDRPDMDGSADSPQALPSFPGRPLMDGGSDMPQPLPSFPDRPSMDGGADMPQPLPSFPDRPSMDGGADMPQTLPSFPDRPLMDGAADMPQTLPSFPGRPSMDGGADMPQPLPSFPDRPSMDGGSDMPQPLPSFPDRPLMDGGSDMPQTLPSFPDRPVLYPDAPSIQFPQTTPSFPNMPVVSPMPPLYPDVPMTRYCNLRFLYAAGGMGAVNVLINGSLVATGLTYGCITAYAMQPAGNALISIVDSNQNNKIIARGIFTLQQGSVYTIAFINEANGFSLYQMTDRTCRKSPFNSCVRAVNLCADASAVNFAMQDGRMLAGNLSFKELGAYRQFSPGNYRLLVYQSCPANQTLRPQPRGIGVQIIPIVIGTVNGSCTANLLLSAALQVAANKQYTLYLIGSMYGAPALDIVFSTMDFN